MDEERRESSENDPLLTDQTSRNGNDRRVYNSSRGSPDGLRAWIVAFSIFVVNFLIIGLGRVSGIFYVDFMREYNINRKLASTPFSVQQATRNLFGPVVGILGALFSVRALTMTGGLIAVASTAGCAFATNIVWISVLWGDFYGIATAFTSTINQSLINMYFVRNRSSASGVAFAGGSMGSMVFPFIVDRIMTEWGDAGTFFTMSALLFLIVPVSLIMRTPPWLDPQERTVEIETGGSHTPHDGRPTDTNFGKSLEVGDSTSDQSEIDKMKGTISRVFEKAQQRGDGLLSSQVLTSTEVMSGEISKSSESKIEVKIVTIDERTPLTSSKDLDSKRKGILGVIFQPIASIIKEMFVEPPTDTSKIILPVSEVSRLDDKSEVVQKSEKLKQNPNIRREEDFDSIDSAIVQDQSPELVKRIISSIRTKAKQLINPNQGDKPTGNVTNKPFFKPVRHSLSLQTEQAKWIEGLLEKETTHAEVVSERSTAVLPSINETDESSSTNLNGLMISRGSSSQEVQSQNLLKETKQTDKTKSDIKGTRYSENFPYNTDSKSSKKERTQMHHTILQFGTAAEHPFTIHQEQENLGKEIRIDDVDVINATCTNSATTLISIQDIEPDLPKEKKSCEQMASTVKLGLQRGGTIEEKQFSHSSKDKNYPKASVSVVPGVSTETFFSHSLSSTIGDQLLSLEGSIAKNIQYPQSIEKSSFPFNGHSENEFEDTYRKDYSDVITAHSESSSEKNIPIGDDVEFKRNEARIIVESEFFQQLPIEKLLQEDNALISPSSVYTASSLVTTAIYSECETVIEKIDGNAKVEQRTGLGSDTLPGYEPHLLIHKSFQSGNGNQQKLSASLEPISSIDAITQSTADAIKTEQIFSFKDNSNNTTKIETLMEVHSSEESFQTNIQSMDPEQKEVISFKPHTLNNIADQFNSFRDGQTETSENDFSEQENKDEAKTTMSATGAIKKIYNVNKYQNNKTSKSKESVPFWPAMHHKQDIILQDTPIEGKVTYTDISISDIDSAGETKSIYFYIDFGLLHKNINYIIHIIRITETFKEMNLLPYSHRIQNMFTEKSEIRKDLELFLYLIEETVTVNNNKFRSVLDTRGLPGTFSKGNGMFGNAGKGKDFMQSEQENETYHASFRNEYIYKILLSVCQENESNIASHFPEQDQEHILKIILELKKLVRHCQVLESNYSTISKRTTSGQMSRSNNKSYATSTEKSETQRSDSVDFTNRNYGAIQRKGNGASLPPSSLTDQTSATNTEVQSPFEHSGENPKQNKNKKQSFLCQQLKVAAKLYLNPVFLLIAIGRVVHFFTFMALLTIIVDFGIDKGLTEEDGRYLILTIALGDFFGRLCCGWVTDFDLVSLEIFMMISMILQGVFSISLYLAQANSLVGIIAVFSILQGAVFVRHPVLVCKYTKPHEHSIGLGFINLSAGILGFAMPNYIGYFRDEMGSYNELLCINGGMCICVGLLWAIVSCYQRFSRTQLETSA